MHNKVNGNISGLRSSILDGLSKLYEINDGPDVFAGEALLERMAALTHAINREISVYIRRNGAVADVSVGSAASVLLPELRLVRNELRLSGVRCIHTHPQHGAHLSAVDIGTLKALRLDAMAALGIADGRAEALCAAFLGDWEEDGFKVLRYGPVKLSALDQRRLISEIYEADARVKALSAEVLEKQPERAVLVSLEQPDASYSMKELRALASTAGALVVGESFQKRRQTDSATYVGSGKVEELALMGSALCADIFIFDDELSAVQLRNLEQALKLPVVDRTALILDIFAGRALSREGRLQVELAQLRYRLPRLIGAGLALSRLGGGIGTRGPGEKKLEIDRRRIRERIFSLEQELNKLVRQRALQRGLREKNEIPLVALVGYTNAGKSTLINALSGSEEFVEDKLFATLDPVFRQVTLKGGTQAIFSDTVGFINRLPHELVKAFRATLEEVARADLILHVVDCSNPQFDIQMQVVEDVLMQIGASSSPRINVYNKIDREGAMPSHRGDFVHISAKEGLGLEELLDAVEKKLCQDQVEIELTVPYDRYEVMSLIRAFGRIMHEEHGEDGVHVSAKLDEKSLWKISEALKEK